MTHCRVTTSVLLDLLHIKRDEISSLAGRYYGNTMALQKVKLLQTHGKFMRLHPHEENKHIPHDKGTKNNSQYFSNSIKFDIKNLLDSELMYVKRK